jgi:TPR repeat protein
MLAERGDIKYRLALGQMHYKNGDLVQARNQFTQIIQMATREDRGPDLDQARALLGTLYLRGEGGPKDLTKALELLELAADQVIVSPFFFLLACKVLTARLFQENPIAQNSLGIMHRDGLVVRKVCIVASSVGCLL